MQSTKKRLLASSIAVILCCAMLLGTTLAWFAASVTNTGNVIQTGDLEIGMYWSETLLPVDSDEWKDADGGPIFTYNNWRPGYTDVKYVRITNQGDLNLKWTLTLEAGGTVSDLSDVIDVYYVNPATESLTSVAGLTPAGNLTKVLDEHVNAAGALVPQQSTVVAIAFHMQEGAGNSYQGLSLCENGFTVKLIAVQDGAEDGSLGDGDDTGADWGENSDNFAASAEIHSDDLIFGALANDVFIGSNDGVNATVPANVKLAEGATSLDLSVKAVDTDANITVGDGEAAMSLDVHIEGVSADNTVPMVVRLGAILAPGLGETEVKLYHTEGGVPVQMTRVAGVTDFSCHNQFTYDPATGNVCIYVATFSVFSALRTAPDTWDGSYDLTWYNENDTTFTLTTAEQFAGFRVIVDGGYYDAERNWVEATQDSFAGKTVILSKDIDLQSMLFDPIGFGYTYGNASETAFMGTFDGGNHTIYNLYQNGWDLDPHPGVYDTYSYGTAGGGLFASVENATVKNLVISGADIVFECIDMGIVVGYAQGTCHFENIVVTDSTIANYNRYTGGVVGEVSYGPYGTDTTQGYSHTFKNIVVDSSVKVSGLWGSFGCGMGGVIGGKWGDATVKMENVISAAEMDVFNDVVSAYQWYAFRGCGMLIGHTEEPYSDGRHAGNATANFLTCENVKVYYGSWVNQTYYEFANQTDAEGNVLWYSNYPWVRAEEGEYCDAFSNIRYGIPLINGVKVTELSEAEFNAAVTNIAEITFDQLYGADRGMYGTGAHEGVTVIRNLDPTLTKTVYVVNHNGSSDLKLQYWFSQGTEVWTPQPEGIDMAHLATTVGNAYQITVPVYADGFKILSGGEEYTFTLSELIEGGEYDLDGTVHDHNFATGTCPCGEKCRHTDSTAATCTALAKCNICGASYGSLAAHSLYWANDDESYCHERCRNCSYLAQTVPHTWSGSGCSQCKRTQYMIGTVSDTDIAYGLDTTLSIQFKGGSKDVSNYDVYIMQGTQALLGQEAKVGTLTFNVAALAPGAYNIVVVDSTTEQWVAAVTSAFKVRDVGVQKKWAGSSLTSSHATRNGNVLTTKGGGGPDGLGGMRIGLDGGGTHTGGYLVIKFKTSSWMAQGQANTLVGTAYQTTNDTTHVGAAVTSWKIMKIAVPNNWTFIYLDLLEAVNPNRSDHVAEAQKAGNTFEIEYIAVVTEPAYVG